MSRLLLVLSLLVVFIPMAAVSIGRISFTGAGSEDAADLVKASGLKPGDMYDPDSVAEATKNLYDYFLKQGHYYYHIPAPELIPLSPTELELSYTLRELVSSDEVKVIFAGTNYLTPEKLHQLLLSTPDKNYRTRQLPALMEQVLSLYHKRSYLFARVQLDSLVLDSTLAAHIGINEGKPLRVKEYVFRGNKTTQPKTLLKISGLAQVKSITPEALTQGEENLLKKSYITDCVIEPLDESSILIRIEEGRMTYLEGVMGMNNATDGWQFSGQINLQFLNLWGSDRAIKLFWKQVPAKNKELSLFYHDSGFQSIPLAADISLSRSEQDSTWIRTKAALAVYYQLLQQDIGIDWQTEGIRPGTRRPITISSSNLNSISAFWNSRNVEGGANPYRGYGLNLRNGLVKASDDPKLRSTTELGVFGFLPLSQRWVGYLNIQGRNLNKPDAEQWMLYKMGGYGTLRGYYEDEFSSYRLGWINCEMRYRMNRDSRLYLFFDQGNMMKVSDNWKSDLFGLGGGIKVNTKLGILGIEYGLGFRDKRFSRIGMGMIHAGLETSF